MNKYKRCRDCKYYILERGDSGSTYCRCKLDRECDCGYKKICEDVEDENK